MLYNLFENRDFVSVFAVALLAEGVDRNSVEETLTRNPKRSPSSRRAWIEIYDTHTLLMAVQVALLAEGVDRNLPPLLDLAQQLRRPPRGGRG